MRYHKASRAISTEHNRVLPHSAFRGQTPDEIYFGTGDAGSSRLDVTRGRRTPGAR